MDKYIRVYKALLKMNLSQLLIYRANFFNSLISTIAYGIFSFVYVLMLTARSSVVYGWSRDELILLMALYNIVIGGFFHMVFSRNFDRFSDTIHFGRLDTILLKPIDSQFLMSTRVFSFTQVSRMLMGAAVAVYIIQKNQIIITIGQLFSFIILSLFGVILLYSIWFMVMTLTVKYTRLSNLVNLLYHLNDLSRFPSEMYRAVRNYLFFVIPYTLILVTPVSTLLRRANPLEIGELLIIALVFLFLSRKVWQFTLRSYTSAGG
jgi:ABC-2 type transport system permease protein